MQPYFFPFLGHFSLIASVDEWIVFDVTQYTPKTWMNRNRVLHPKAGWQYVTVPLAKSSISINTSEARVLDLSKTRKSMLGKLTHYKKKAPYFHQVNELVQQAFDGALDDSLVGLNISALSVVCNYLDIPFLYRKCSELGLDYPSKPGPGDWAPYICQKLGASEYVNPAGGKDIFDLSDFQRNGLTFYLAEFEAFKYATPSFFYEPNLSILDVMMWNSPKEIVSGINRGITLTKVG